MVGAIVVFEVSTHQTNKVPSYYSGVLEDHVFYVSSVQAISSVKGVVIDSSECIINLHKGMDGPTFIFIFPPLESIKGLIPKERFSLVDKHSTFPIEEWGDQRLP